MASCSISWVRRARGDGARVDLALDEALHQMEEFLELCRLIHLSSMPRRLRR